MSEQPQVSDYFVHLTDSVADVIAAIDRSGRISLALLVDQDRQLINTISDGDVRRGLLAGTRLTDPVSDLLPIKARTPHPEPVTAPAGTDRATLLALMQEHSVRQLPLLDRKNRVVDIVILTDFLPQAIRPLHAVVMAGGQGLRLRPLTDELPKPMLPVGGRPLIEHIVAQLRDTGIEHIDIATYYQAEKIRSHLGDGGAFGVSINYVQEKTPLGTGGALGLLQRPANPVLVINGDILTDIDFRTMFLYHQDHGADLTVAVRRYEMRVPYGVIECDGPVVQVLQEKPELTFFVNAGIYLLEPTIYDLVTPQQPLNMTELIARVLNAGRLVVSFPICEYWLDIGQHEHYRQAQLDVCAGKLKKTIVFSDT
jgi:dTDP-glucose pyrophosphorylase/CBS domain-containing protein